MNIKKMNIERLRSKQKSYKNILRVYEHPMLVGYSKIYEIYQ